VNSKVKYSTALKIAIFIAQARAAVHVTFMRYLALSGVVLTASKLNYSAALEKARMDAITTAVGNAGILEIRDGTQPAGPGTTAVGTLGASFTLGSPFAPGATSALPSVLSPTLPSNVNGGATITQTWFRVKTSGGVGVLDGSAGTSGCDLNLSGTIVSGQPVSITSWTITSANFGH
jgi:hypothetical protein